MFQLPELKHLSSTCPSRKSCRDCGAKHYSLFHQNTPVGENATTASNVKLVRPGFHRTQSSIQSLARTALVLVSSDGQRRRARAILDTGATIPLVTRKLASTLKANRIPESAVFIYGLVRQCYSPCHIRLKLNSLYGNKSLSIKAHVVVDAIPAIPSHVSMKDLISKPFLKELHFADPDNQPNCELDNLLGIKQCNHCSLHGISMFENRNWKAEETIFGWAVGGVAEVGDSCTATCLQMDAIPDEASKLMQKLR